MRQDCLTPYLGSRLVQDALHVGRQLGLQRQVAEGTTETGDSGCQDGAVARDRQPGDALPCLLLICLLSLDHLHLTGGAR